MKMPAGFSGLALIAANLDLSDVEILHEPQEILDNWSDAEKIVVLEAGAHAIACTLTAPGELEAAVELYTLKEGETSDDAVFEIANRIIGDRCAKIQNWIKDMVAKDRKEGR